MKKVFLSVAVMTGILSSCGTSDKVVSLAGEWNIVSVEGQNVSDNDPFLGFDVKDGRIYGNAGCNNIMGSMKVDSIEGSLELSQVAATRKMCPDMKTEGLVLAALEKVKGYKASENGVELTDAEGKVVFGLEKKVAPVADVNDMNGEWIISKVNGNKITKVEKTPFIAINVAEKTVHGTGGCNIFNGGFSQENNVPESFVLGDLATTMMAGPGLEQEGIVLEAFKEVASFVKVNERMISLKDKNNNEVILLVKNTGKSLVEE